MPKYRVYAIMTAARLVGEFEAEDADSAEDMAAASEDYWVSLCHQCAREIDLGEAYRFEAEEI